MSERFYVVTDRVLSTIQDHPSTTFYVGASFVSLSGVSSLPRVVRLPLAIVGIALTYAAGLFDGANLEFDRLTRVEHDLSAAQEWE